MNETEQIEQLKAELRQSEADAEHWRQVAEAWRHLCDAFQASGDHWHRLYLEERLRAGPLLGELADGGIFHEWFERNV